MKLTRLLTIVAVLGLLFSTACASHAGFRKPAKQQVVSDVSGFLKTVGAITIDTDCVLVVYTQDGSEVRAPLKSEVCTKARAWLAVRDSLKAALPPAGSAQPPGTKLAPDAGVVPASPPK